MFWFKIRPIFLWAQSEKVKNARKQSEANKQTLKPGDPFQHFKEKMVLWWKTNDWPSSPANYWIILAIRAAFQSTLSDFPFTIEWFFDKMLKDVYLSLIISSRAKPINCRFLHYRDLKPYLSVVCGCVCKGAHFFFPFSLFSAYLWRITCWQGEREMCHREGKKSLGKSNEQIWLFQIDLCTVCSRAPLHGWH